MLTLTDLLHNLNSLSADERRVVEAHLLLCRLDESDYDRLLAALGFDESSSDLEVAETVARHAADKLSRRRNLIPGDSEDTNAVHSWVYTYLATSAPLLDS